MRYHIAVEPVDVDDFDEADRLVRALSDHNFDGTITPIGPEGPPRRTFRITYEMTQRREAWIEAMSESAARQAFIDQDHDYDTLIEDVSSRVLEIEEVDV